MGEFELIARYFTRPARRARVGVGDDCAVFAPQPGCELAVSTDMLVAGRHFFADTDPQRLGHKALAVNLSDLAACGARPLAFTLALALPSADEAWLAPFAHGLLALADAHGCELVGGDTTRGPLNLCLTVFGEVPAGQALLRRGARPGDAVYVSGALGEARAALAALRGELALPATELARLRQRLEQPDPRVALGLALRGLASAAADLSDGLTGDLGHVLRASGVGATLSLAEAWDGPALGPEFARLPLAQRQAWWLSGGDDYELVFTAAPERHAEVLAAAHGAGVPVTRIGRIEAEPGLRVRDQQGVPLALDSLAAFDHFAA